MRKRFYSNSANRNRCVHQAMQARCTWCTHLSRHMCVSIKSTLSARHKIRKSFMASSFRTTHIIIDRISLSAPSYPLQNNCPPPLLEYIVLLKVSFVIDLLSKSNKLFRFFIEVFSCAHPKHFDWHSREVSTLRDTHPKSDVLYSSPPTILAKIDLFPFLFQCKIIGHRVSGKGVGDGRESQTCGKPKWRSEEKAGAEWQSYLK